MTDASKAIQDVYTLFIQDDTISEEKKSELSVLYKTADTQPYTCGRIIRTSAGNRNFRSTKIIDQTRGRKVSPGRHRYNQHYQRLPGHFQYIGDGQNQILSLFPKFLLTLSIATPSSMT